MLLLGSSKRATDKQSLQNRQISPSQKAAISEVNFTSGEPLAS